MGMRHEEMNSQISFDEKSTYHCSKWYSKHAEEINGGSVDPKHIHVCVSSMLVFNSYAVYYFAALR